jgi:hypothetical protein
MRCVVTISAVIALPVIDFASKKWGINILRNIYSKWTKSKNPTAPSSTPAATAPPPPTPQPPTRPPGKKSRPRKPPSVEVPAPITELNVRSKLQLVLEAKQSSVQEVEKPSLRNQTDTKEMSSSALQTEDEQHLTSGESNEQHGIGGRFLGFFNRRFGSHLGDEEKALK